MGGGVDAGCKQPCGDGGWDRHQQACGGGQQGLPDTACEDRGFVVDDAYRSGWRDRLRDMQMVKVRLFREGRAVTADVFLLSTPFQEAALERTVLVDIPGVRPQVPVVSAADLILFKLMANRPKDSLDVQNVLTIQGVPDEDYLRLWAARLAVTDQLLAALEESGLDTPS